MSPTADQAGTARPRRRPWDTITGRTIGVAVAAALITALVTLAVSSALLRTTLVEQARATLVNAADIAAATLQNPRPGAVLRLNDLLALQDVQAFVVAPGSPLPEAVPEEVVAPLFEGESVSTEIKAEGTTFLIEGRPVRGGGVLLAANVEVSGQFTQPSFQRLLLALALGLAAAVGVALIAGRRVTRSVRQAAQGTEKLIAGRRDVMVPTDGPTEVAEMADAVNRLSAALETSEGRQRDFLLSVSHELRTPLTAIGGYAEALADGVVAGDDSARTGALMLAESRRLERLVTDLLDLSRLGASEVRIDRRPTELRALVATAAAVWRDRCAREDVRLAVELPPGEVVATTDAGRVRQILDNLAENALRVTPADGLIVLALRAVDGAVEIQVRDSGPGLTPEDRAEAFEPGVLYERYRGVRPVSSGVGLALVGRLAQRLGGSASAGTAAEGGAAFTVRLPLAPVPGP